MIRHCNSGDKLLTEIKNTKIYYSQIGIWFLGQEGFIIKTKEKNLCFDPFLTNCKDRAIPPILNPENLSNLDHVFCSHHHDDHLDIPTLKKIANSSKKVKFIIPAAHKELMKNIDDNQIILADDGKEIKLKGIKILPIAVKHENYETDANGHHLYLSYLVKINNIIFFHAGDTIGSPDLLDKLSDYSIDVIFLPINGRDSERFHERNIIGNMNYREAANLAFNLKANLLIPMHHDVFLYNSENPAYLSDYLWHYYPSQKYKLMVAGEGIIYNKF
jgi:L-ascorbate metabolism protein UlaG (beta-lactamase superfamily)